MQARALTAQHGYTCSGITAIPARRFIAAGTSQMQRNIIAGLMGLGAAALRNND
jgi:hypothetical protein